MRDTSDLERKTRQKQSVATSTTMPNSTNIPREANNHEQHHASREANTNDETWWLILPIAADPIEIQLSHRPTDLN